MKRIWWMVVLLAFGCDAPKVGTPTTVKQPEPEVPFQIEPQLWGTAAATAKYEIRQLPDGAPGLFAEDGALLLRLLPELVIDGGAADKPRPKPSSNQFEVVKLSPNPEGGFTLLARAENDNGRFDLRVESGPRDPRIHVGLTTKWVRDVRLQREILRFAIGPVEQPRGLGHDGNWVEIADEWTSPAHTAALATFDAFSVIGRAGSEGFVVRHDAEQWHLEIEAYHHENHPIAFAEACSAEPLAGAGLFAAAERTELRADIVLGAAKFPIPQNFPQGRRAAVALADFHDGASRSVIAPAGDGPAVAAPRQGLWLGDSTEALPCAEGRSASLAASGVTAMWSGALMVSSGANLLAPTETDGRRAFAFNHPGIAVGTLFAIADAAPDAGWFDPGALARLKADNGLLVARAPLQEFLSRDASATATVREALTSVASDPAIWLAPLDEVATRMVAMKSVDLDLLPEGVVRVRNLGTTDLEAITLQLPDGAVAKYPAGVEHASSGTTTWMNLAAGRDQLLQLFSGDSPLWTVTGVDIAVSYEPAAQTP